MKIKSKAESGIKLAIFDTFKTKGDELTGEANRQRAIITILASNANPAERTRTGISQRIAKKHGIAWKKTWIWQSAIETKPTKPKYGCT